MLMNMHNKVLTNGDRIHHKWDNIIIEFNGNRNVLSTSSLNGGIQSGLKAIYNHCDMDPETEQCDMHGNTYEEHLAWVCDHIHLNPETTTGLTTAASMRKAVCKQESFKEYTVTVISSGGIGANGRRAGETATLWERDGIYYWEGCDEVGSHESGTLNLLVHIDAKLSPGAMATALMVIEEAKAATIVERGERSCYSDCIASGSGTDGIILITDADSDVYLTRASTDVKLGECIGKAVSEAVDQQLTLYWEHKAEEERVGHKISLYY